MSFATEGYEVRSLFTGEDIARLRQCVAGHMDRVARALFIPYAETEPDAPFDERIERIAGQDLSLAQLLATAVATDAQRAPDVVALARHHGLTEIASLLAGCAIGEGLCRFRFSSPSLPGNQQAWHSDVVRTSGTCSDIAMTAWIPLSDAGPDSGGLEIAAGRRTAPIPHRQAANRIFIPPTLLVDHTIVQPDVPAGHCLFIDPFTPQRTLTVEGRHTRWSLVIWLKRAANPR